MTYVPSPNETTGTAFVFNADSAVLVITTSGAEISDAGTGVSTIYNSDRIVNSGEISGADSGIYSAGDSLAVTNSANATVDSGYSGIFYYGKADTFTNGAGATLHGAVAGAILEGQNDILTNAANGEVDGGIWGAYVIGASSVVTNHGQIDAAGGATGIHYTTRESSDGVEFYDAIDSQLVNSGSISGAAGVAVVGAESVSIVNSGTITGTTVGIEADLYGAFPNDSLTITNSGTIINGVQIGTDTAFIHNSGTIHGNVSFGTGTNTFDGAGGTIDGSLTGGTGNDTFELGRQTVSELIDGGAGVDTLNFNNAAGAVIVDLAGGTVTGPNISDHIVNFESVYGSIYADTLSGDDGNNVLNGNVGAEIMSGGLGNDTYYVDNVGDKVIEAMNGGNDVIFSSVTYSLSGLYVETLALIGNTNINATSDGNANTLNGNAGNNVLDGGAGADTMAGGAGDDTYYVDNVGDKVIEATGGGNDTVYSSVSFSLSGTFVETLALTGSAAINATGNGQANTLIGNSANNVITTGGGADIVVYTSPTFGADTITDFTAGNATGHDTIQFASSLFANFAAVTAHAAQVGSDTIITYDAHDTIDLQGVTLANLTASDFAFV